MDSESSDAEDFLQWEEVELSQPSVHRTNQQCIQVILTWLVYFILVWQYKNYISNNAIEQLLNFVQQLLFCISQLIKDHTDLCLVLGTNLYSARRFLKIDRDNFQQYVVCPKCTKLYHMDEVVVNDGLRNFAKTCNNVPFPQSKATKNVWCTAGPEGFEKWKRQILYPEDLLTVIRVSLIPWRFY